MKSAGDVWLPPSQRLHQLLRHSDYVELYVKTSQGNLIQLVANILVNS